MMTRALISSFITTIIIAGCTSAGNNYFTGTINYRYSYTSDSLNQDSVSRLRPVESSFRYDENGYQSRFTGKDTETYYYSGLSNKCVSASGNPVVYACGDYGIITDSVLSAKLYETDEKVLGYRCKILELQKGNSWVKYYISTDLRIAPGTYRRHKSYNWDVYGEKANGGLILKLEHRFKKFTMSGIATSVSTFKKENFRALEIDEEKFSNICK